MSKQILIELVGENETGYCYADLYLPAGAEELKKQRNGQIGTQLQTVSVISALRIAAPFPSWRVSGWTAPLWMN